MRVGAYPFVLAIAVSSCTRILGIDGEYVLDQREAESGGAPSFGSGGTFDGGFFVETGGLLTSGGTGAVTGGMTGNGGIIAAGGIPAAGGGAGGIATGGTTGGSGGDTGGAGPVDARVPCGQGTKSCNGKCVMPDPSVGCGLTGCDLCPGSPPAGGYFVCSGDQCDFACVQGLTKDAANGTCDAPTTGTGGSAGSGGSGGSGGAGTIGSRCSQITVGPSAECRYCGPFPGCCNVTKHCGCLYVAACI